MREVCLDGPGHYLGSDQTLRLMQSEYVYPTVGNRMSPKEWDEAEQPRLLPTARTRMDAILSEAGNLIPADVDARIRERFPIRL